MTTEADNQYQVKCPSCGEMVYPVINIKDDEQPNDHAWAECPKCGFNTGNREDEMDAFRFFENPGRPLLPSYSPREKQITEYMRDIELTQAVGGLIESEDYDELAGILRRMLSEEFGLEQDLADWLWRKLMDWCKKRGYAPADYNDLFAIVEDLRSGKK